MQEYTNLVRLHLEYANAVWNPYKMKHIDMIENVQRRATRLVPVLETLDYENRLRILHLPTLSYRRMRGGMIKVYNILSENYYFDSTQLFQLREDVTTRGDSL